MLPISAYLTLILVGGCMVYFRRLQRPANYPPGPPGMFSFFTVSRQNEPYLAKGIERLSRVYGSVVGYILLHRKFITISGYKAVTEALSNPLLAGRPDTFNFSQRTKGFRLGVLMTDGSVWKEQRRFTIRHLKDLGFGKSSLEGVMMDEIGELTSDLNLAVDSSKDGNVLLDDIFTTAVLNILWAVVASSRFKRGDPKMETLTSCMNGFMRTSNGGPNLLSLFPFIRHVAPELSGYKELMRNIGPLRSYIEEEVAEHKKTRQLDSPRDFIDVYLETLENEGVSSFSDSSFHEEQLLGIIFDVLVAGSETTSHTLGFALLYMIMHPHVQRKVQEELDQTLQGRSPSLADKGRLPYTEATIQEIQRMGVVAPLTVPHVAEQDTSCQGYHIPKKAVTFINLWSAHMDPDVWPDPTTFKPERHLNSEGKLIKADHLVTFGLGKRSCIGETLARSSIFLFFTSLMQHFRFELPINSDSEIDPALQPSLEPIPGLTLAPRPCLARVIKREF